MKHNLQAKFLLSRIIFVALAAAALLGASPAIAAQPFNTANGFFDFAVSDHYTLLGTFGGDTYYREDITFPYLGDLTGVATDVNYIVVHADDSFESVATEVCNGCTIGGRTGNFTATYFIVGEQFDRTFQGNSVYSAYFTFTGGSGGLAGLRGYGTFDGSPNFSYSYHYRFGR